MPSLRLSRRRIPSLNLRRAAPLCLQSRRTLLTCAAPGSCAAQAPGAGGGKPAPKMADEMCDVIIEKLEIGRWFSPTAQTALRPRPSDAAAPAAGMVSSDDDRDRGLKFGFRAQQRMRERERREKSKDERKKREREADEEREMMKDVAKRIAEGDLRARVLAKVAEQLKTDEVQARLAEQVDTARAAMRKVRGGVRL